MRWPRRKSDPVGDATTRLWAEHCRQRDFATSVANITSREVISALAEVISGQIAQAKPRPPLTARTFPVHDA